MAIPDSPLVYWLRPHIFTLLRSEHRLGQLVDVRQGLATSDNDRFVRCFWEVAELGLARSGRPVTGRWSWYSKGGRYQKWAGLEWLVINWESDGREVKQYAQELYGSVTRSIKNQKYYFRPGITYTLMAQGNMGVRLHRDAPFDIGSMCIFSSDADQNNRLLFGVCALLSTRTVSWLLRVLTQDIKFNAGYVANIPMPNIPVEQLASIADACIELKLEIVKRDPLERTFQDLLLGAGEGGTLLKRLTHGDDKIQGDLAILHTLEGLSESLVSEGYDLDDGDVKAILDETGKPSGWFPLLPGHERVPPVPSLVGLPSGIDAYIDGLQRCTPDESRLKGLKSRLRALYQAGPGGSTESRDGNGDADIVDRDVPLGAYIPIPAETFLEELSQKLEIHPISIYCLLKEMREQEGLVSPPELKRQIEDFASVTILRLLGYRWPDQDRHEKEHGPILAPDLVDEDGIIPLVPCAEQPTAEQRIRMRLERDFGDAGAEQSLQEFRQWVGRDLGDWLKRDFFKRHVQQFKQRPIAWHLVSPERTFEAFVLYHKLSRATIQKLRAQYAGGLITRLQAEQERARQRGATADVNKLQLQIEDVEEFRTRLEKIERGDELKYRIRCRWKGEEAEGRPGPYNFDIDDGVKVNIRPFQEAGLLAVREVIKKW